MNVRNQPDILIFLSDQHHAHYIGYSDKQWIHTPNMDRLAREGTVFETAYTSCPLCVPARVSFLTGQLPSHTGIYSNGGAIAEDQATFIHSLAAEGYETVLCGRMHFMGEDQRHGFTKRIMGEMTPLYWGRSGAKRKDLGSYAGKFNVKRCLEIAGGGDSPVLAYDRAVTAAALEYLKGDHKKPQCIVVGTYGPHFSYVAPQKLYQKYRKNMTLPHQQKNPLKDLHPLLAKRQKEIPDSKLLDIRAAYFGMIEQIDNQLGMVKKDWDAYLKRNQHQGVFIYLSDHGDQAGEHHLFGKETFYEGSVKIPMIVAGDGIQRNKRIEGAVSMMDVGPTLCEITGALPPPNQDGRSLCPQIFNSVDETNRAVLSEFMENDGNGRFIPGRMIRQKNWKLISYAGYEDNDILFDLQNDPLEQRNALNDHPKQYNDLKTLLDEEWDVKRIITTHHEKMQHIKILNKWGANTDVEEKERWSVPIESTELPRSKTTEE